MQGRVTQHEPALDLDPETLGKPKVPGSLLLHVAFIVLAVIGTFATRFIHHNEWGNQLAPGAIQATLVSSAPAIPLPQDTPPTPNVLATEMPSPSPPPPLPAIAPVPPPDAIPIPERKMPPPKKKVERRHERPAPKHAQPQPVEHRAQYGEAPATQMPRSLAPTQQGPSNPITVTGGSNGFNYPWYVSVIQRKVSQAWYTQEVDPHTPYGSQVSVTFSISRDGTPSNIRIMRGSGSPTLDSSALRAVQRVENFSPLPSGYSKSSVSVEYTFTYKLSSH
ncbi:MAG: energy transducer TonB [Acidobacteriaceae bacterium]